MEPRSGIRVSWESTLVRQANTGLQKALKAKQLLSVRQQGASTGCEQGNDLVNTLTQGTLMCKMSWRPKLEARTTTIPPSPAVKEGDL